VGQVRIKLPFSCRTSHFTSAIERSWENRGKIATAWPQFGANERSESMYRRMRVPPWSNTLLAWGSSINLNPLRTSGFTNAIEREKWKKVR
jgi:hypothetical protein